jgi:predicted GNAT family acetyltransferase
MDAIIRGENIFYMGTDVDHASAKITLVHKDENTIIIKSTFVSEPFREQGLGLQLVKEVVEYARQENKKIIPKCLFARKMMTKNDEYKDVLVKT